MFDGPGASSPGSGGRAIAIGLFRLALAITCIVALIGRYLWGLQSATFDSTNFFAYLTMQSNFAFVFITTYTAISGMRGRTESGWLASARAGVLGCTVTAGIVFALLVQQASKFSLRIDLPWSDQVLHFFLPALALVDWFFLPRGGKPRWRAIVFVLGYALTWGGITMLRGSIVGWYPYFFLDPGQVDGPGEFLLFSGLSLALFAGVTAGVVLASRVRIRRKARDSSAPAR